MSECLGEREPRDTVCGKTVHEEIGCDVGVDRPLVGDGGGEDDASSVGIDGEGKAIDEACGSNQTIPRGRSGRWR